jgi:tight adherence protein C
MPENAGIILQAMAALLFGGAVTLLALAVWYLIQRQRTVRSGSTQTSMRRAEMRQIALNDSATFRFFLPLISSTAVTVNRMGLDSIRYLYRDSYVRAGYPGGMDDDEVVATGVLLALAFTLGLGFVAGAIIGVLFVWVGLVGAPLGFFALSAHFKNKAEERQIEIMRSLPYALDLLVLMLRSGTSMRIALARVIEDYTKHPLGVELGQVLAEIDVGAHRADAFKKMAERLKIPDITSLVDAIVQSEELGWALADTLERLADRMSAERVLRAQTKAGAAGVYVMVPSTMVLLSAVILLFAPFIVTYLVTGSLV